jgi:hypothetical protein
MRVAAMGLLFAVLGWGQSSTPIYWRYAPAEPAMLIGVDWRQTSQSNLAGLIGGAAASLEFAEEITNLLVAVEPGGGNSRFLATAAGRFNLAKLRRMAATDGAKTARYRGVEVFSAGGTDAAVLDGWVLLVGDTASVRAAIDRGNAATPRESPLWRRAAELSSTYSIWIATSSLEAFHPADPSPLSGVRSFDGGIALNRGLEMAFDLEASSEESAVAIESMLRAAAASPALRDLAVGREGPNVRFTASLEIAQMETGLKAMLAGGTSRRASLMDWVTPAAPPRAQTVAQAAPPPAQTVAQAAPPRAQTVAQAAPPPQKRVIRIVGLEEGTREFPFPLSPN